MSNLQNSIEAFSRSIDEASKTTIKNISVMLKAFNHYDAINPKIKKTTQPYFRMKQRY